MEELLSRCPINPSGDRKDTLLYGVYGCAFFSFPFTICSFVVAGTANAGFNAVLTAMLNIAFVASSYFIVNQSKTPIAVGFLIGSSCMMAFVNFMTAVFWGQLSHCNTSIINVPQYSCSSPSAYGALCAFAVFLFLIQVPFAIGTVVWRGELINESGVYDNLSSSNGGFRSGPKYDPMKTATSYHSQSVDV